VTTLSTTILAILCLLLAGFCVWSMGRMLDKTRESLAFEHKARINEREAAFRREKFLIAVLLGKDPQTAAAISKLPAEAQEQPDEFLGELAGYGPEAPFSRQRP
jgi:hypothetical protein